MSECTCSPAPHPQVGKAFGCSTVAPHGDGELRDTAMGTMGDVPGHWELQFFLPRAGAVLKGNLLQSGHHKNPGKCSIVRFVEIF